MNIESVKIRVEDQLMSLPNVVGVAIGEKNGKPVIKVYVTHKQPAFSLRPDQVVPRCIDGFATDVEAIGDVAAQD